MVPAHDSTDSRLALPGAPVRAERLLRRSLSGSPRLERQRRHADVAGQRPGTRPSRSSSRRCSAHRFRRARACGSSRNVASCASCTAWSNLRCWMWAVTETVCTWSCRMWRAFRWKRDCAAGRCRARDAVGCHLRVSRLARTACPPRSPPQYQAEQRHPRRSVLGRCAPSSSTSAWPTPCWPTGCPTDRLCAPPCTRRPSRRDRWMWMWPSPPTCIPRASCCTSVWPVVRRSAARRSGKILFEHMTAPVPELSAHGVEAPAPWRKWFSGLLRKDPRDRYQSADGVLADLQAILAGWERGERRSARGRRRFGHPVQPDGTGARGPRQGTAADGRLHRAGEAGPVDA